MRPVRLALLAACAALLAALPAGAQGSGTTCMGGETASRALWIDPPPVQLLEAGADPERMYVSLSDGTLWHEANGQEGLQRTARVCYDQTWDASGTITSSTSYVVYPADGFIVP